MTTQTIKTPFVALTAALEQLVREFGRALSAMAAGSRAAGDYRRLTTHTDAALAREGLSREAIARAVQQRNFA